jgi:putative recF/recN/SMC N domain protein
MYISELCLKNYKSFKNINIKFNEKFNIIVGENNIGKSSIFEALLLWKHIYNLFIKSTNKRKKFYSNTTPTYLNFNDLNQIRIVNDDDLFFDKNHRKASILVKITDNDEIFSLEVSLEKTTIKNSYFRIYRNNDFDRFAKHIENKSCSLQDAIFIYQTKPLSAIYKNEPFYNNGQIEAKINLGKSHDVLRNKILKTEISGDVKVDEKFSKLERRVNSILGTKYKFRFKNRNRNDDEFIKISIIKEENADQKTKGSDLDISLMGSGFLQIVEIFSTLEYIKQVTDGICLILVDEPDSHIHANTQVNLIKELRTTSENSQVFIISHNDRLISEAYEGELLYLNNEAKQCGELKLLDAHLYDKVSEELAGNLSDEPLPLILTEGKTDKIILEIAWRKLYPDDSMPFKIIQSGINNIDESKRAGNADTVRRTVEFLSTIYDGIVIGLFDNDREGVEQLKGLNKAIFEDFHCESFILRKHKTKAFYGITLPVPQNRKLFVTEDDITQRYLSIEMYFPDKLLEQNGLKGASILNTEVFKLNDSHKSDFANICDQFDKSSFNNFYILFDEIKRILNE